MVSDRRAFRELEALLLSSNVGDLRQVGTFLNGYGAIVRTSQRIIGLIGS